VSADLRPDNPADLGPFPAYPTQTAAIQAMTDREEAAYFASEPDPLSEARIQDLNDQLDDEDLDGPCGGIIGFSSPDQMHRFYTQPSRNEIDRENVQRSALGLPFRPRDNIGRP
jgi:hypothetical protein